MKDADEFLIVCQNCFVVHENNKPAFVLRNYAKGENLIHLCKACIKHDEATIIENKKREERNEKREKTGKSKESMQKIDPREPPLETIKERMTNNWNSK